VNPPETIDELPYHVRRLPEGQDPNLVAGLDLDPIGCQRERIGSGHRRELM
jgi:hypothetical protein